MQKSPLGKLSIRDAFNGLLLAVASAVMTAFTQMLTKVPPVIDWKEIGTVALITALSYIGKQLSQNSTGQYFKKD